MADAKISQLPAATTPLSGSEVLPLVQSSTTKKVATNDLTVKNVRSNASTGILQVAGPAAGATRVMTTPDANFSVARIDAGQTFTGNQVFNSADVRLNPSNGILASVVQNGGVFHQYYKDTAVSWVGAVGTTLPDSGVAQSAIVFSQYNGGWSQLGAFNSAGFTVNNGNFVIGTAGKGIDFSANANAPGMTSEVLTWYEEGNWTPSVAATSGTITTLGAVSGTYTRIGRRVFVTFSVAITTNGTGTQAVRVSGLPFAISGFGSGSGRENGVNGYMIQSAGFNGNTYFDLLTASGGYPGGNGYLLQGFIEYNV